MKNSEVKELSTKELVEKIETEKTNLLKMKLNHSISPIDNTNLISEARKTIARMKTELRQRELSGNNK